MTLLGKHYNAVSLVTKLGIVLKPLQRGLHASYLISHWIKKKGHIVVTKYGAIAFSFITTLSTDLQSNFKNKGVRIG